MATEENKGEGEDETDQEDTRKDTVMPWCHGWDMGMHRYSICLSDAMGQGVNKKKSLVLSESCIGADQNLKSLVESQAVLSTLGVRPSPPVIHRKVMQADSGDVEAWECCLGPESTKHPTPKTQRRH